MTSEAALRGILVGTVQIEEKNKHTQGAQGTMVAGGAVVITSHLLERTGSSF